MKNIHIIKNGNIVPSCCFQEMVWDHDKLKEKYLNASNKHYIYKKKTNFI